MCLLIIKPSNVKYDHDFIIWSVNNGITYNRDGIGGAVRKQLTNTLLMNKGFFNSNVSLFYEWLESCDIQPGDELMIHLRQGTAGQKSTFNQHPYILGELPTEGTKGAELTLDSDNVETGVFAHNGIFYSNSYFDVSNDLSDSFNWAYSYFGTEHEIKELKLKGEDAFTTSINQDLLGQKVCFMFPDRELIRVGNFHSEKGFLFSNKGYTNGSYNDRGGVEVKNNILLNNYEDDDDDDSNPYNSWWINALNNTRNLLNPQSSNLELPKTEEAKIIDVDDKANIEIKKKVNTSFDYSIEILETLKPDTKIININNKRSTYFKKTPNVVININDDDNNINTTLDVCININNKNKDHFLLRAKKDITKINGNTIKTSSIHYIVNCYASTDNSGYTHALAIKSIDFENDLTNIITTRSLNDDFQVIPKKVFTHIYRDYMKLVNLYGESISNNKRKKLRTICDTLSRLHDLETNRVSNFYKTKFNSKALVMFYENFYKEEVPKIKSRLENKLINLT